MSVGLKLRWLGIAGVSLCLACGGSMQAQAAVSADAGGVSAGAGAPTVLELRHSIDSGHAQQVLTQVAALRAQGSTMAGLSRVEGLADYALGNMKSADAAFAQALKEDAKDSESAQMRGLTLVRLGRPADAIPLLEAARVDNPDEKADPNYILALCYMDTRRYDDARHAFAAQYGFAPDGAEAYLLAARMLLRREFLPVAQSFAEKSIALEPGLPLAHELLGEIELAGNHLDESIAEFEKERAHNPLEGAIYDRLGDAYVRAGKYDQAERSLQEAVLLEPNATGPYILLGKTLLKKSDPLGAATYLERAVQMDPANYMTHNLLGQAYRALGRHEDATRETAMAQRLQTASEPKLESLR
jgi:tetratricopeptide (TPR) repeat protein